MSWEPIGDWTDEPMVCISHWRFVPCRFDDGYVFSTSTHDVQRVRDYLYADGE